MEFQSFGANKNYAMNSYFVSHEAFRNFTNTYQVLQEAEMSLQLKAPYHTTRKSIINIVLNALNVLSWLITASKLLQRKSILEKIESFLLYYLEIGSPLGLVTSRLLSNVEAAEDWAALVGMWTKEGWIPGLKGYKKEKKNG